MRAQGPAPRLPLTRLVSLLVLLAALGGWGALMARAQGGAAIQATEGQPFSGQVASLSIDCAAASASGTGTISWGDGSTSPAQFHQAGTGELDISGSHTYAEEGSYDGDASGRWSCGGTPHSFRTTFGSRVDDAPLSATGRSLTAAAGERISGTVATVADADPAGATGDYSASIDWGDGSTSTGSITAAGGGFAVGGSHTYPDAGVYPVIVTVSDQGGAQAVARSTVTVGRTSPAPTATFTLPPGPVLTGKLVSLDASASRVAAGAIKSFDWTINGGQAADCAGSTSMLQTRFLEPGSYRLALTVTAPNGTSTRTQHVLSVGGAGLAHTGRPGRFARAAHVVRTQQIFTCLRSAGDPVVQIVPPTSLPTPGPSCSTQVQAGIFDATGCLTENLDEIKISTEQVPSANGKPYWEQFVDPRQALAGVPGSDARWLLENIDSYYFKSNCTTANGCTLPQGTGAGGYSPYNPPPTAGTAAVHGIAALAPYLQRNVVLQTVCSQAPQPGQTSACLDLWVSTGPVTVNGLTYVPENNTAVVVAPQFNLIVASDAEVDISNLQAKPAGTIDDQEPTTAQPPSEDLPALDAPDLTQLIDHSRDPNAARQQFGSVGGFQTDPRSAVHVGFNDGGADITFYVDLAQPFSGGTAEVHATISDTQAFQVDDGYLANASVNFGALQLTDFSVCFRHDANGDNPCPGITGIAPDPEPGQPDFWDASGTLSIGNFNLLFRPGAKLPPGCSSMRLGIGFGGGQLAFAGLDLQTPGIAIAPGVTFQDFAASFDNSDPRWIKMSGCADFNLAALLTLSANVFSVVTNNGAQYPFSPADVPGLQPPFPVTDHLGIGASGTLTLSLPIGDIPLAQAYALYVDDPPALFFGGGVCISIPSGDCHNPPTPGLGVGAAINGGFGLQSFPPPFFVEGSASVIGNAPIIGTVFRGSVHGIISDDPSTGAGGIGLCGQAYLWPFGTGSAAFAYHWHDNILDAIQNASFDVSSCDDYFSNQHLVVNVQSARAAAAGRTVHVPRGTRVVNLHLFGRGGAPDVTLAGPHRLRATTAGSPADLPIRTGRVLMARAPQLSETYIVIPRPPSGTYRIALNPGSPPITSVGESLEQAPGISARVTGRGIHRRLVYRFPEHPGEVVTFVEHSRQVEHVLGRTRHGRGSIAFLAAAGRGPRAILAEINVDGVPEARVPVTSYQAPSLQPLARVRAVRVDRLGDRATVSWAAVRSAPRYEVSLVLSDGTRRLYRTTARRLTLPGIFLEVGGHVLVRAEGDLVYTASGAWTRAAVPPWLRAPGSNRRR